MPTNPVIRFAVVTILLLYLAIGALFALRLPDWQAPDEPAHYNVIAQMAAGDLLPVIEMGDWDNDYLERLKAQDFAPELLDDLDSIQYEDHQPPLYYWLLTPVFLATDGSLTALRLVSVLMGAMTVTLTFFIVYGIPPHRPQVALAAMALVAFLPQHLHILASINNDALAGAVLAILLWLSLRYLKGTGIKAWQLGLVLGIAFLTKTTIYFMGGVLLVVIGLRHWIAEEPNRASLLREYLLFGIPAGIFALLYWGRNILTYGFPDFLGLGAHDAVVVGQLRTADYMAQLGSAAYWETAIKTTFNSFWGKFGWMEANLGDALPAVMIAVMVVMAISLAGVLLAGWRSAQAESRSSRYRIALGIVFGLILALTAAQFVYYNLTFVQFQGRYLFTALIPFSFIMALGLDAWRDWLLPDAHRMRWLTPLVFVLLAPLDLYLIWRVIPGAVGGI